MATCYSFIHPESLCKHAVDLTSSILFDDRELGELEPIGICVLTELRAPTNAGPSLLNSAEFEFAKHLNSFILGRSDLLFAVSKFLMHFRLDCTQNLLLKPEIAQFNSETGFKNPLCVLCRFCSSVLRLTSGNS